MRSKAQFKGHPIHPMLIPFPIAFLVGAFVADLTALVTGDAGFGVIGGYLALAGIITGVIAAIPGFIDYVYSVPPRSSGKKRASMHMAVNLGAVAAFLVVLILRGGPTGLAGGELVLVEAIGLGLLGAGGWMGGTLVYRNQIGVDHRYARAGKWQETRSEIDGGRISAGQTGDLEVDQMKLIHVNGRRLVLARTEEGLVAFDDRCTHRGASLADGAMICGTVQCPWHGSQFDLHSGAVKAGPAEEPIGIYPVEVRDGRVWIVESAADRNE